MNASSRRFDVYPAIDLREGRVVRLTQGDFDRETRYDVDPLDVAAAYQRDGATWLHVVDLDGARTGQVVQNDLVGKIIAFTGLLVQTGGGVRSREDVDRLLDAGAARVVVGTRAVGDWPWLESMVAEDRYARRITLAVDARDGVVTTAGWQASSGLAVADLVARTRHMPLAAILYTDVARDGLLGGVDVERTSMLAALTDVPVLASGGVGGLDDLRPLARSRVAGVVVGRAIYEGRVNLAEMIRLCNP